MKFVFYYIFFSIIIIGVREKKTTIDIIFPICIIINNIIYHYVSTNKKISIKPLKSRYNDYMVISEEDIVIAKMHEGYTVQGYMYLKYYDLINILFLSCEFVTHFLPKLALLKCT